MNIVIKNIWINDVTDDILLELKVLFEESYVDSKMYVSFLTDIEESHKYFQVFLAYDEHKIIWIGVLEDKLHKNIEYYWNAPVHVKRFMVEPIYRSRGIWKLLLDAMKEYAKEIFQLSVIFWESNEIGAMAFYLREGALFHIPTIKSYSQRNDPEDNLNFFKEFITNKNFRTYRYPVWKGIPFVYILDESIKHIFIKNGFMPRDLIFNIFDLTA